MLPTRPALPRFLALIVCLAMLSPAAGAEGWVSIGPTDVGMVTSLSAGSTAVYAATCNGIYRSDDGGSSWHEAGLQGECVLEVDVDPRSDTIYAILHSPDLHPYFPEPYFLTFGGGFLSTLWVSPDGGQSWTQTPLYHVVAVAVDPTAPDTAYATAAFSSSLFATHDSGKTWSPVPELPAVAHLTVDPRDGAIYGTDGGPNLIWVAGGSWNSIQFDFSPDAVGAGSGADGAVYLAGFGHFCRRTTAAPEWTCNAFPGSRQASVLDVPGVESEAPRILVAGFDGVWSSDDGGTSWSLVAGDPVGYTPALALDPSGSIVYAGNDVGVYRSADRGDAWTNASGGLRSTWVRALALDPTDPSTIWVGAEGRVNDLGGPGLFRSTDAGGSWTAVSGAGELVSVSALAIDPSNPLVLYAGFPGAVIRTEDGGASWSRSTLGGGFVFGLAVDPDSARVWAASDEGGLKSSVGGQAWSSSAVTQDIFCLLFDSRKPGTIYAGAAWEEPGYYYPFGLGGSVFTSRDGGDTWTRTEEDLGSAVLSLAIDPFSDSVVYAGTDAGTILRSPDAGVTWERWDTDSPGYGVMALVADPVSPGTLYAGTWRGVSRSVDGGRDWHPFSGGLSPYAALGLAVSADGRRLYAGTDGGGVFEADLTFAPSDRLPAVTVNRPRTARNVPPRPPP